MTNQQNQPRSSHRLFRVIPFALTLALLLSLVFLHTAGAASADNSTDSEEDSLPEYTLTLSDEAIASSCESVLTDGRTVTITETGSYTVSGSLSNGQIRVDADKDSKVQLVLDGVSITNNSTAAIYVASADKLVIKLAKGSENVLTTTGSFAQSGDSGVDAVIFSREDLTIKGSGSLTVSAPYGHGIVSKDDLKIKNGNLTVTAGRKTLAANDSITVDGGVLNLTAGTEGMESTYVQLNDGTISIQASDDGINATRLTDGETPLIEINGGEITIVMGPGDTDGIDSNGNLTITGGTIDVTGNSTFDVDGTITFTGGTVLVNGQQVDSIPNQMMGGFGGFGHGGQMGMGGFGGFGGQQGLDGSFPQQPDGEGFGGWQGGGRPGKGGPGHG